MPWNPEQYGRFAVEREAPFVDALAMVRVRPGLQVVDLGCGTGELTRRLADALPDSEVLGIDSSTEMLARAEGHAHSGLTFEKRTIEEASGAFDLIFSHAALHWVADHTRLIPRLLGQLRPGGQLVVQLPSNHEHASQALLRSVVEEAPFRAALSGGRWASPVLPIARYAELLHDGGIRDMTVFEKVYPHVLDGADAIVEWLRGTTMLPYLERLPPELREQLVERYRVLARARWPERRIFYGFRRILFSALKT